MISDKENIHFDINPVLEYSNINPYFIYNLFNKLKLLNKPAENITIDIKPYILSINYSIFDGYIESIIINDVKKATNILFKLYDTGYSLLDIYHFMYEYFKLSDNIKKYKCIEQLCIYIQYIYDGFDNKLMLLFYSNDLISIYI